jgi:hypothetical protein
MLFHHGGVRHLKFGADLFERRTGRQPAKQLSHAVDAAGHHGRREVVGTGDHVGDNLGFGGIGNGRFKHTDHGGRSRSKRFQPDDFPDHRWIALEHGGPETVRQNHRAGGGRAVVAHIDQPSQHRMQPHHVEITAADHARMHLARLAQPVHGETDGGEIADRAKRFDAFAQVVNLRHGERGVLLV